MRCLAPYALTLIALLSLAACGKAQPTGADSPSGGDKTVTAATHAPDRAATALPAAVSPSADATAAAAAPADATAAEPQAPYQPSAQALAAASVAIFIDTGAKNPPGSPTAGQLTTVTVTPVDGNGRPLRTRDPVFGAELVMVAMRHDLSWVEALRTTQLSEPGGLSHRFTLKFPKPGRHLLYFLVKPAGGPVSSTPVDLTVRGDAEPEVEWQEDQLRVSGPQGLTVELRRSPEQFNACRQTHIATTWMQKGKPAPLQGPAESQRVLYLAIPEQAGQAAIGQALQLASAADAAEGASPTAELPGAGAAMSVEAIGGDAGTDAWLTLRHPGRHRILALAQLPDGKGEKPGTIRSAAFAVTAGGTAPAGGCP